MTDASLERDDKKEKCLEEIVQLIRLRSTISLRHDDQEVKGAADVKNKHRSGKTQQLYDTLATMSRDSGKYPMELNEDAICVNRAMGTSYGAALVGTKWKR